MRESYQLVETDPLEDDHALRRGQCAELERLAAKLGGEGKPDCRLLAISVREVLRRRKAHLVDRSARVSSNTDR